jgi:hypothetical protein
MKLIYSTNNDYGTSATYVRGSTVMNRSSEGTCAAQAVIVLQKFRSGVRPMLTKPEQGQALILQASSEMGITNGVVQAKKMLTILGLKLAGDPKPYGDLRNVLQHTASQKGLYLLGTSSHLMSIINCDAGLFFFDANDGLFECNSRNTPVFVNEVEGHITQSGYNPVISSQTGKTLFALITLR